MAGEELPSQAPSLLQGRHFDYRTPHSLFCILCAMQSAGLHARLKHTARQSHRGQGQHGISRTSQQCHQHRKVHSSSTQTVSKITVCINTQKIVKEGLPQTQRVKNHVTKITLQNMSGRWEQHSNCALHTPRLTTGRKAFWLRKMCSFLGLRFPSKWWWGIFGQWGIFAHFPIQKWNWVN
jgi:hypothetical protein